MWGYGLDRARQMAGTYDCGNEPSGSMKCGEFLDWLKTGQLLTQDSTAWSKQVVKEQCLSLNENTDNT